MKASDELIEFIKDKEDLRLTAYRCPKGVPTIGWGHTKGVKMGMTISEAKAEEYLRSDVAEAEKDVARLNLPLKTQGQYDAITDFIFNLGLSQTKGSTLFKYIRQGKTQLLIVRQFMAWVYSGGKVLNGLVKRRKWEAERYVGKPIYKSDDLKWYIKKT